MYDLSTECLLVFYVPLQVFCSGRVTHRVSVLELFVVKDMCFCCTSICSKETAASLIDEDVIH